MLNAKQLFDKSIARFLWSLYEREKLEQDWLKYVRKLETALYCRLGMRKLRWYYYPVMSDFGLPDPIPRNLPMHQMLATVAADTSYQKDTYDAKAITHPLRQFHHKPLCSRRMITKGNKND